jgi:hypothetical protein
MGCRLKTQTLFCSFILLTTLIGHGQPIPCRSYLEKEFSQFQALILVKEPYCKGCLPQAEQFVDSCNVPKKQRVIVFEHHYDSGYQVKLFEKIKADVKLSKKQILAIPAFPCEVLNGIYIGIRTKDGFQWTNLME